MIQAILPTHGLVSWTKFHNDKARNVDFLLKLQFGSSLIFFRTVSISYLALALLALAF